MSNCVSRAVFCSFPNSIRTSLSRTCHRSFLDHLVVCVYRHCSSSAIFDTTMLLLSLYSVCANGTFACTGTPCVVTCSDEDFKCPQPPVKCIPHKLRCDGVKHCSDGADERDCRTLNTTTITTTTTTALVVD